MNHFTDVIKNYREGELLAELDELYRRVIEAVDDTGKKGEVTLKLTITPPTKSGAMPVYADIKSKILEMAREGQSYFVGEDGGFQLNHPRQIGAFDAITNITPITMEAGNEQ